MHVAPLPVRTHTLSNGIRAVLVPVKSAPVFALQVWVGVGSADEVEAEGGLAHVHEHMLFKGTKTRGVGEIAKQIEASGGEINAWTSFDQTVYHVVIASRFQNVAVDVLSDAVRESAFDPDELERELEVILEEIKRSLDQPSSRVSRALFEEAFAQHPYRRPIIGHADVVKAFSREQILAFYAAHYRAERIDLVAVGDFEDAPLLEHLEKTFGGVAQGARALEPRAVEPEQTETRVRGLVDDVEEAQLAIGFAGPDINAPDIAAIDLLSVILGQGQSSRLSRRIKHDAQIVNEIYAYAYTPKDKGLMMVGASLRPERVTDAIAAVAKELRLFIEEGVTEEELAKAKTILSSEAIFQRETVEGLARRLGFWLSATGDANHETHYQAAIAAVTRQDIAAAAARLFVQEQATIVALAPNGAEEHVAIDVLKAAGANLPPRTAAADVVPAAPTLEALSTDDNPNLAPTGVSERVRVDLESGGRLIVERDPTHPAVAVRGAWLGGLRAEPEAHGGIAHLYSEMLTRGTANHDAEAFAEKADSIAAHVDAFAGRNSFGVRGTFLREPFDTGFELLRDALHTPTIPAEEFEKVRALMLEDIRARKDNIAGLAFNQFNKMMWATHPYRRDILGTDATVRGLTRDDVVKFGETYIAPEKGVLSIVGAVDLDDVKAKGERLLSARATTGETPDWTPQQEPAPAGSLVARLVRDRAQAHLVMGHRGLTLHDNRRYTLEVLSSVLSGQGGRLFLELRDKESLCYSVSAFSVEGLEPGTFAIYMGTSPDKVDRALAGIDGVVKELCDNGITQTELDRARRYLVGANAIGLQQLGARASVMCFNELYGMGYDAHLAYDQHLSAVTLDDVRALANDLLSPDNRVLSIVGPESTQGPEANVAPKGLDV